MEYNQRTSWDFVSFINLGCENEKLTIMRL